MDRGSTFADDRIIEKLSKDFVPVVGNTHELQNGRNKVRDWFMAMAKTVKPDVTQGITAQGFYVVAPDGKAYGFNNNRGPERVLQFMTRGMDAYKKSPPAQVAISQAELDETWAKQPSAPAQTLRIFSRIKPLPLGCDELNLGVGRDTVWIYQSDLDAIVGKTGHFPMPKQLSQRLARYHLLDNVRGEPDFWTPEQIKESAFEMWPKGGGVYAFSGKYSMATADNKRGLRGKMEGEVTIANRRVTKFAAFGEAKAWGAGTYTPRPPEGVFPLLFAIVDVSDEAAKVTPPQAASYGDWEYRGF